MKNPCPVLGLGTENAELNFAAAIAFDETQMRRLAEEFESASHDECICQRVEDKGRYQRNVVCALLLTFRVQSRALSPCTQKSC